MRKENPAKVMIKWIPPGRKAKGRIKERWNEQVEEDLRKMGIQDWATKIMKRKKWRNILKK